jgi:hypothetical protein
MSLRAKIRIVIYVVAILIDIVAFLALAEYVLVGLALNRIGFSNHIMVLILPSIGLSFSVVLLTFLVWKIFATLRDGSRAQQ